MISNRIDHVFAALKAEDRAGLVTFIMGGDPNQSLSLDVLRGLPGAGADIIELGMPFSDPTADGPTIQAAGIRARQAGTTLSDVLAMANAFRAENDTTPLVLMGYYNPIFHRGEARFIAEAQAADIDALIIVDLPPEEDETLWALAQAAGIHLIRLITPTTTPERLQVLLTRASGFLYYVAVTGVTGGRSATVDDLGKAIGQIRAVSELPVVVGFGVKNAKDVAAYAPLSDGVVVGSAIVHTLASTQSAEATLDFVRNLKN